MKLDQVFIVIGIEVVLVFVLLHLEIGLWLFSVVTFLSVISPFYFYRLAKK